MFFFSISGSKSTSPHTMIAALTTDITYVASILFMSLEPRYLLANASWLAGSGLTIFLDIFVLGQFVVFSIQDKNAKLEAEVEEAGEED